MLRNSRPAGGQPRICLPNMQGIVAAYQQSPSNMLDVGGTTLDVEPTFCHLVDMVSKSWSCDSTIVARCCSAWCMFRKLLPVLTSRLISFRIRGKVYFSCVRSTMLEGIETWGRNVSDLQRLRRNDRAIIRWICGVKPVVRERGALRYKFGICDIINVLRSRHLRWFRHV